MLDIQVWRLLKFTDENREDISPLSSLPQPSCSLASKVWKEKDLGHLRPKLLPQIRTVIFRLCWKSAREHRTVSILPGLGCLQPGSALLWTPLSFSHRYPLETENSLRNSKVTVWVLSSRPHWNAPSVHTFLCFVMCILIFFFLEAFNSHLIWTICFWKAE